MPHYFFHLHNGVETRDEEGLALDGPTEARAVAEHEARAVAAENVSHGHLHLGHAIEVTDSTGAVVMIVHFRDVVAIAG